MPNIYTLEVSKQKKTGQAKLKETVTVEQREKTQEKILYKDNTGSSLCQVLETGLLHFEHKSYWAGFIALVMNEDESYNRMDYHDVPL